MTGITGVLIKLGVRLVVFTAVFWLAARKHEKIVFAKRWAPPVVALVFAALNTALYWLLKPVLDLATMGAIGFALPLIVNGLLLWATVRVLRSRQWFQIEGVFAGVWMALLLNAAHGALWVALDYIPSRA